MQINSTRLFWLKVNLGILLAIIGIILCLSKMIIFSVIFLIFALCMIFSFMEEPTPLLNSKIILNEKENTILLINYPINVPDGGKKCINNTTININFSDINKFEKLTYGIFSTVLVKCKNTLEFRMYLNRTELDFIEKLLINQSKYKIGKHVTITDGDGNNNPWVINGIVKDIITSPNNTYVIVKSENDTTIGQWTSNNFVLLNRYEGQNLCLDDTRVNVMFVHKNYDISNPINDLIKNSDFVFIGNLKYKD